MLVWCPIWLCIGVSVFFKRNLCSALKLNNDGGYEDIVIAISSDIKEQNAATIIPSLQSLIRNSSKLLHESTKNCFYFKSATILLPSTWNNVGPWITNGIAKQQKYTQIYVVKTIDGSQNPLITTQPPRECGKSRDFIRIETDFFIRPTEMNKDYLFLQTWARYRYGIFEESGIPDSKVFPPVYRTTGDWKLTGCEHPNPWKYKPNSTCPLTIPDQCQFELQDEIKVSSSVMSKNGKVQASFFCGGNDNNTPHNHEAPTPQNAYCRHKSTWEVIKNSEDYKGKFCTNNPAQPPESVEINVLKKADVKTVIVVDPELCQYQRRSAVTITVANAVAKLLKDHFRYGGVGVLINDDPVPEKDGIAKTFFYSCISNEGSDRQIYTALKHAAQMFQPSDVFTNIIFVMDGTFNVDEDVRRLLSEETKVYLHLINYPARVSNLAFDAKLDSFTLSNIKDDQNTGSMCDVKARVHFDQIFTSIIRKYTDNFDTTNILISEPVYETKKPFSDQVRFSLEGDVTLVVYLCDASPLLRPSMTWNGKNIKLMPDNDAGIITNSDAMTIIIGGNGNNFHFNVGDKYTTWYALTFWMEGNKESLEFSGSVDDEITLATEMIPPMLRVVTNLQTPIITASVTDLTNPANNYDLQMLKSTSVESDSLFTGTYVHHFIRFSEQPATYSVIFTATDNTDKNQATYTTFSSATFTSKMTTNDVVKFPPQRILDFRVDKSDYTQNIVTFLWTAPGAHYDNGIARFYYLRCDTNMETNNNGDQYKKLNISPKTAGSEENYDHKTLNIDTLYYCTIKSEGTKMSEPSNTVVVFIESHKPPRPPTQMTTDSTTQTTTECPTEIMIESTKHITSTEGDGHKKVFEIHIDIDMHMEMTET